MKHILSAASIRVFAILGTFTVFGGGLVAFGASIQAAPAGLPRESLQTLVKTTVRNLHHRGVNKVQRGDYKGAIEDFNQALQIDSKFFEAYCDRAVAQYSLGDNKSAIADWNQALQIAPNHLDAYDRRGNARAELGDYKGAIQDYTQALAIDPSYADAYYNRGLTRSQLGDNRGAIQDYS